MSTTQTQNKSVKPHNLQKMILAELRGLESQKNLYENFLKQLGGITEVREQELTTHKTRKSPFRGGPAALHEALKSVNGEFTVDRAVMVARESKLDLDRTQILNSIQLLIKRGQINVVKAGLGRSQAVYQLAKESAKSKKETAGTS